MTKWLFESDTYKKTEGTMYGEFFLIQTIIPNKEA